MRTFCSFGGRLGGPASSNRASRVRAAGWCTARSRSLRRSSSQRRLRSSIRSTRSALACANVANPAPCTHTSRSSTDTTRWVAFASSARSWETSRTVFVLARSCSSNHSLAGTSR